MRPRYFFALVATLLIVRAPGARAQSGSWVLPSSAFAAGLNFAEFHTDVRILNPGTSAVTVTPRLYDQASGTSIGAAPFSVAGRSQASFDNVLQSLFGRTLGNASYGPIRFDASGPILVSSSVNNVNACGTGATSGQWLPGIDVTKALTSGVIPQLAVSSTRAAGYRTNLVVMNPGTATATATVKVRSGIGDLLSTGAIGPLGANGFAQVALDSTTTFPGISGRTDTNLWLELTSDQPVLAFATVINNVSGDPFAIVATSDSRGPCSAKGYAASDASTKNTVCMLTDKGEMVLEVDAAKAPVSVANFLRYVNEGFYNGTTIHRVVPNFVIQGGGFTHAGADYVEKPATHGPIVLEKTSTTGLSNVRGSLAMARLEGANSATNQFFVNAVNNVYLDSANQSDGNGYAVFGKLLTGLDVVDAIRFVSTESGTAGTNQPVTPIVIQWMVQIK